MTRTEGAAARRLEGTGGVHAGATRIGVGAGERHLARSRLNDPAASRDGASEAERVAAVEVEQIVVEHIARDRARRATIADQKRTRGNRRAAAVGVGACQIEVAGALRE